MLFENSKMESYSRAFAEKLCNEFFASNEAIRGEQILRVSAVEQVNLFVIKILLDKWKDESQKLKNPYFNYESHEVKEALKNVLDILSRNIYIRKEFFKPLLEKAVFDSLYLLLSPEGFFKNNFIDKSDIKLSELKESEKYYKINKPILQGVISSMEKEGKETISSTAFISYISSYIKQNPADVDQIQKHVEHFSSILKLDLNMGTAQSETISISATKEIKQPPQQQLTLNDIMLNEKFGEEKLTVNDLLRNAQSKTLADKIGKSKIETIKGAISLSQKFLFINALFKGENLEYENALSEIDKSLNYDAALEFLSQSYAKKYNWDFNQHEVKEFVEIVERKFS